MQPLEKISWFSKVAGLRTTFIFIQVHVAKSYKLDKYTKYENLLCQSLDGV